MSDRKSGDINMFGDKIQTCSVTLNKLNPDITRTVLDRQKSKKVDDITIHDEVKVATDAAEPEPGPNTLSVIKGEDSEKNIRNIVESSEFEEFDITTQLDILDTSKKKIEEIKRKSQEQISQLMEVDGKKAPEKNVGEKVKEKNNDVKMEEDSSDLKQETKTVPEPEKVSEEKWKEGEKILCFHGPLIYEAKIQRLEIQNGIPKYFIHYHGWNKNWDEWVPEARMMKFCEKNVEIQKDLCLAHEAKEKAKKLKQKQEHIFAVPKNPSPVPTKEEKGRRKAGAKPKKRDEGSGSENFLIKNGKQMSLCPPDNTVESEEQYKTKLEIKIRIPEKMKNNKEKAILEVTAGIREYFNVMLSRQPTKR